MMPADQEETYTHCQRCKRTYPEPCTDLLCGECDTRCPVCGSSGRGCQNPSEFMLSAQSKIFSIFMEKHRRAGDELWWFKAMDAANKAANLIKAYRLWCTIHKPTSAEPMPDDGSKKWYHRCSIKPGEAICEYPGCTSPAYWEY